MLASQVAVQALRWLGAKQQQQLETTLTAACLQALQAWCKTAELSLAVQTLLPDAQSLHHDATAVRYFHVSAQAQACLTWVWLPQGLTDLLQWPAAWSRDYPRRSILLRALELKLMQDLTLSILPEVYASTMRLDAIAAMPEELTDGIHAHTQIVLVLQGAAQQLCGYLVLHSAVLEHLVPQSTRTCTTPLCSLHEALMLQSVAVTAALPEVPAPLQELQALRLGDVWVLNCPLKMPFALKTVIGKVLTQGTLGMTARRRALRVL